MRQGSSHLLEVRPGVHCLNLLQVSAAQKQSLTESSEGAIADPSGQSLGRDTREGEEGELDLETNTEKDLQDGKEIDGRQSSQEWTEEENGHLSRAKSGMLIKDGS